MDKKLEEQLKYLRLQGLLANWDRHIKSSKNKRMSTVRLLKQIIEEEYNLRKENARKMRLKRARIPEYFVMETYPFKKQPKLNRKKVLSLYDDFTYLEKNENIIWIGPPGCGKTGLATGFLIDAINRGHKGRYILFRDLIGELFQSVADHSEEKIIKKYISYDILLIDELGYVEVEPVQIGLFFTLMHKRHKRKSTFITSNMGFSDWHGFFKNKQLSDALIDRLTEKSHVINMKDCISLRQKNKLK